MYSNVPAAKLNMSRRLFTVVIYNDESYVRWLLDTHHTIDINAVGGSHLCRTALGIAVWRGHEGIVTLLLDRGADINSVQMHALGVAAYKGYEKIVTLLLNRGADVNTVGGAFGTALGVATY